MWNLGGAPTGHVYTEECTVKYLVQHEGDTLVEVSYSGRYYKEAEIQDGVLKATGEHGFGKYSSFGIPLKKMIQVVKLLKPTEVTHAVTLAKKVASLPDLINFPRGSNICDLDEKDYLNFTVVLDTNDPMKSSAEAFLSFKLAEAAGLDKNPEGLVVNVIAKAILPKNRPEFPEEIRGAALYRICDSMVLQLYKKIKKDGEEKNLPILLEIKLKELAPEATVMVEKVTRKDHPEFDDFHGDVHFFKATVDKIEAFLAFGANQTEPAYIYYN